MYKGFYGWSLENVGKGTVETRYFIEIINDKKVWEKFCRTEDCELYTRKEYDNIADALTFYITWFVNESCYDIKMWEHIYVNGDLVLEQIIEPKGTTAFNMKQSINREMSDRMYKAEQKAKETEMTNGLLLSFVKMIGADHLLAEFLDREENK